MIDLRIFKKDNNLLYYGVSGRNHREKDLEAKIDKVASEGEKKATTNEDTTRNVYQNRNDHKENAIEDKDFCYAQIVSPTDKEARKRFTLRKQRDL